MPTRPLLLVCLLGLTGVSCTSDLAPETTPPWTIGDLTVHTTPEGFHLRWTATGDDGNTGRASHYDIRYADGNLATAWASAHVVTSPLKPSSPGHPDSVIVQGIGLGPWQFGVKIGDEGGNWSEISNVVTASIDTMPPAAIGDLTVRTTVNGFYLRWTAPSDNGTTGRATRYEIRYAPSNLVDVWNSATVASSTPTPGTPGQIDSVAVLGIDTGPWEFGIKSSDQSGNVSDLSNVVTTTILDDLTAPGAVTDLTVDLITEQSVVLRWSASGDDGDIGQAFSYDVRYSLSPITAQTWDDGTRVQWTGAIHPSGERELMTVPGLQGTAIYYFALKALDEVENSSDLSNQVHATPSSPTQLTFGDTPSAGGPDWSPDGQKIAYMDQRIISEYTVPEIFVIPATGGTPVRYTETVDGAGSPAWSPDGTKFAFSLYTDESTRTMIAVMNTEPNAPNEVIADPGLPWKSVGGASWSPDGTRIAYTAGTFNPPEPPVSEMFIVPSTGGASDLIAGDGTWSLGGPDWSPDGTQIVYSSNQDGSYHLWIMPSTGGSGTPLTAGPGEISPSWSPDGTKIAYATTTTRQIWVVYSSGENPTQVTFDPGKRLFTPAWSPDGQAIAFPAYIGDVSNIWSLRVK